MLIVRTDFHHKQPAGKTRQFDAESFAINRHNSMLENHLTTINRSIFLIPGKFLQTGVVRRTMSIDPIADGGEPDLIPEMGGALPPEVGDVIVEVGGALTTLT